MENQDIFSKITKFPHQVDYVVGCSVETGDRFIIYGANNLGEIYIYEMTGKNEIVLVDMIFVGHPCIIRNVKMVDAGIIAVTLESGELMFFRHDPSAAQIIVQSATLQSLGEEDTEMELDTKEKAKQKKNIGGFKPF